MAKIKLELKGFDKLLEDIQEAGGNIERATEKALLNGANLLTNDFRNGAVNRGLEVDRLITPQVKWANNRASVEAGFKLGEYDEKNPNSAYIALFTEYGTIKRKTKAGANRGKITQNPFIRPTREKDAAKVRRFQKEALEEILKGLKE